VKKCLLFYSFLSFSFFYKNELFKDFVYFVLLRKKKLPTVCLILLIGIMSQAKLKKETNCIFVGVVLQEWNIIFLKQGKMSLCNICSKWYQRHIFEVMKSKLLRSFFEKVDTQYSTQDILLKLWETNRYHCFKEVDIQYSNKKRTLEPFSKKGK